MKKQRKIDKSKNKNKSKVSKVWKSISSFMKSFIRGTQVFLSKMMVRKKKQKKNKPIVSWFQMLHLFLFMFVFTYDEILLRIFTGMGLFTKILFPLLFSISAGFLADALTTLFKKNVNWIVTTIILGFTSIYFITECLVKRTFHVFMTLSSMITNAGGVMGHYTASMIDTIISGSVAIVLFLLPVIIYIIIGKKITPAHQYKWPVSVASLFSSGIVCVLTIALAWVSGSGPLYTRAFEFNRASEAFGLITGTRLSMTRSSSGNLVAVNPTEGIESDFSNYKKNVLDIDFDTLIKNDDKKFKEMDQYVSSLTGTSMNKYTGLFEGKNLILVCAEGWSDAAVTEDLTPTLYRMLHQGFYFSDFYQPYWGGSTTTGEFSFLLGLVPGIDVSSMHATEGDNNYFTMLNQMQRLGYYTSGFHNGEYDFYERNETHENLGMNKWIANKAGLEEIAGQEHVPDNLLFTSTLPTYVDKQPFCIYYITMDGHMPYPYSDWEDGELLEYVIEKIGSDHNEETLAYYCKQYQLEKAMRDLVAELEDRDLANDTVVCLVTDHYPYGLAEEDLEDLYGYEIDTLPKRDRNGLIIWSGCLEEGGDLESYQCEIDTPTMSLDIIPTLSNLFGLEFDSRMLVGRDVFSDGLPLVLWNDYSWLTTKGYYSAQRGEFIPNSGETADQNYLNTIDSLVKSKKDYSTKVRDLDYFGHVFGKDEITDSTDLWKKLYGSKKNSD